jgi:hypothetical protein
VVAESAIGMKCPLTVWERQLRQAAGQAPYTGDFIGYWAHRLIFIRAKQWLYDVTYILFGMAVLAAFFWAPPSWKKGARRWRDGRKVGQGGQVA